LAREAGSRCVVLETEPVPESETEAELVRVEWAGHAHLPWVGSSASCMDMGSLDSHACGVVGVLVLTLSFGAGHSFFHFFFFIYPFIRLLVLALRWGLCLYLL
jgi:predicted anti-sigma-YlaC factor YlaD